MTRDFKWHSEKERPDLNEKVGPAFAGCWPDFIFHDNVAESTYDRIMSAFPDFQAFVCGPGGGLAGLVNSAPLGWDGTAGDLPAGWDGACLRILEDRTSGRVPDTLCALAATAARDRKSSGMSAILIETIKEIAAAAGMTKIIVPVRPLLKSEHPSIPLAEYAARKRPDGSIEDPWLRAHVNAGGIVLRVDESAMVIRHPVRLWREWTGMEFPGSGEFVIPQGHSLLRVDMESDEAVYTEGCVWVAYGLSR
jgi:hypothetical protein